MKSQSWDLIEDKTSSRSRYVFQPPSSTGNTGSLPYANKTNKLRKIEYIVVKAKTNNLTGWFCFKIAVFVIYETTNGPGERGYFYQSGSANLQAIRPFSTAFMVGYIH